MFIPADDSMGYILEVSLHYPKHLHDKHNDFPLAPESKHIENQELSPYAKQVLKNYMEYQRMGNYPHVKKFQNYLQHYMTKTSI